MVGRKVERRVAEKREEKVGEVFVDLRLSLLTRNGVGDEVQVVKALRCTRVLVESFSERKAVRSGREFISLCKKKQEGKT